MEFDHEKLSDEELEAAVEVLQQLIDPLAQGIQAAMNQMKALRIAQGALIAVRASRKAIKAAQN